MINIVKGKNVIDFYDTDFNDTAIYDFKVESVAYCLAPTTVLVDDVFFCLDSVRLTFTLPCLDSGMYKASLIDQDTQEVKKVFKAYYNP